KRDLQRNNVKLHRENTIVVSNLGGNGKVNNNHTPQVASPRINHQQIIRLESKCSMKGQCARLIQNKIFDLWQYPKSYPKYKTILVLDLNNRGYITTIKLKRSSGIRAFDDSVIKAVRQAAPFTEITYLPALDITEFSSIEMVFLR
ncbi:MAG: TonB family protein, partial [Gammaproteobacteria bacterium]